MNERLKKVIEYLKEKEIVRNQKDFVEMIGGHPTVVSEYVSGSRTPSEKFVRKVCLQFPTMRIFGITIEIGCGNGAIARALKRPATDAMVQDNKEVQLLYSMMGQPVIKYPSDVEKLTAEQAIEKYSPNTVIGCYITHRWNGKNGSAYGVIEGRILRRGIKYINVGNDDIHSNKPILKHEHTTYRFDWLITRSEKSKNFIKIWNG